MDISPLPLPLFSSPFSLLDIIHHPIEKVNSFLKEKQGNSIYFLILKLLVNRLFLKMQISEKIQKTHFILFYLLIFSSIFIWNCHFWTNFVWILFWNYHKCRKVNAVALGKNSIFFNNSALCSLSSLCWNNQFDV